MALPPSIRINSNVPFPALVQGSGFVTLGKIKAVWTIGVNYTLLGQQNPPPSAWATDYVAVYDAIAGTFFRASLSSLGAIVNGGARTQRSVIASPIVVASNDQILNCNIPTAAACTLPAAASRNGVPLTFKDVGAQFAANNLTITSAGADTIDGAATLVLKVNRQGVTLVPFTDGVNSGWAIE